MRRLGPWRQYGGEGKMSLGGYATLLGAWAAIFGSAAAALVRRRAIPRLGGGEMVLLGLATHKLTRIVTKDWVTAPLRAPFTTYRGSAGSGEVREKSRGSGVRRALGDLLTCNYCTGPWVAGALLVGWGIATRVTRAFASLFAIVAVSDFLHEIYEDFRARRGADSAAEAFGSAAAEEARARKDRQFAESEAEAHMS
ncbi:MAG TPA: DUF1360 domain-containing protein [Myxococcaceae bacterium]|nr:DUF1360 domain-containing protein [Myxococcaceae bacterium]